MGSCKDTITQVLKKVHRIYNPDTTRAKIVLLLLKL